MTNKIQEENTLDTKLKISKFPLNTTKFYNLGKDCDWTAALLRELNEKAEEKSPEDFFKETTLTLTLELEKKFKPEYGEYMLVRGHLSTAYVTQCVRTLVDTNDSLELDINTCFLAAHLEKDEAFTDQMEIFEKDQMYELYFYQKGVVGIAEMVHEQLYLHINQYPIQDADTPLHWDKEGPDTKQ